MIRMVAPRGEGVVEKSEGSCFDWIAMEIDR
jgi:hypothetical protein